MRDPHAPEWTKSAVFAAAVLFVAIGLTSRAAAQAKFDRLFVFGDSYADLTLSDRPVPLRSKRISRPRAARPR